jgi:hypothetical protein
LVNRQHHLFSRIEMSHFLLAERHSSVKEIREQYALLPLDLTIALAAQLGVRYPTYVGTQTPWVMTTDLVIIRKYPNGELGTLALAVKPWSALQPGARGQERVMELLEVERAYWNHHGIQWLLVTDDDTPPCLMHNLLTVRPRRQDWKNPRQHEYAHMLSALLLQQPPDLTFNQATILGSKHLQLDEGQVRRSFGMAAWCHLLPLDFHHPIDWHRPLISLGGLHGTEPKPNLQSHTG